jgi:FkbM family methyltransferase
VTGGKMQPPTDAQCGMKAIVRAILPSWLWKALRRQYHSHVRRDYSQSGETIEIRRLLKKNRGEGGFFVELGANDGVMFSSTLGLLKDGWSGLAVEANPTVFARLKKNWMTFAKVKIVCAAVAPERGPIRLFLGKHDPHGLLSTISTDDSEWFKANRSEEFVEVSGVPLPELLEEQGVPRRPDLLLIDTEGMDYDILLTLDFEQYRPRLLVTEDYQPKNGAKFRLLERAGYSFSKRVGCNTFWLDTDPGPLPLFRSR